MTEVDLADLVRSGRFRASRDHELLGSSEDLEWPALASLQHLYRTSDNGTDTRVALDFQRLVTQAHEDAARQTNSRRPVVSVNVRIPESLHEELKEAAAKEGRSLQRQIIWLLEESLVL